MLVLSFDSPDITLANAGGKGLNLSQLVRGGFRVPPGFILATEAYKAFVAANGLQPFILDRSSTGSDPGTAARATAEIRARFETGQLPAAVQVTLVQSYADLSRRNGQDNLPVAVRSSATAEDLPGLSFAGQQDTFLNVIGANVLVSSVNKCWASLWTERAQSYRAAHGIAPDTVALAVVVQALVPAEISGVLFTANPVTGNRDETVVEATVGLGEALVSGQVDPDSYTVSRETWQITDKFIGEKGIAIVPRAGGGTARIVPPEANAQALEDEQVISLARLGARIAEHFGAPQDIEWAIARDEIFILQSRPITTLD